LLTLRRAWIEAYCRLWDLSYRVDSTNLKPVYLRNRIRLKLMPLLVAEYNRSMVRALHRQSEICREEDALMEAQARAVYRQAKLTLPTGAPSLAIAPLKQTHKALVRRVIRQVWRDLTGSERELTFTHVENVVGLLYLNPGARVSLPGGAVAVLTYDSLDFHRLATGSKIDFYRYLLKIPGETRLSEVDCVIHLTVLSGPAIPEPRALPPNEALFDLAKLPAQLYVRRRMAGDLFQPYGHYRGRHP
jgi:tRNA(Ile)-lysidine synthase